MTGLTMQYVRRRSMTLAVAVCVPLAVTSAQTTLAALAGTVRDENGAALPMVRLSAESGARTVISDSAGHFLIRGLEPGQAHFVIRRLGYEPGEFSVTLEAGATLTLDVTMAQAPVKIAGMASRASLGPQAALAVFERHRDARSGGSFIERADIELRHPHRLSDIVRSLPGVDMHANSVTGEYEVRMARSGSGYGRDCPVEFWIDGSRAPGLNIDDIRPGDVEAMEIYKGAATLPPEFNGARGSAACGTIAIWTRMPGA
ncbi:MAG TPA: TonB-dependent receptor [Gemmatimonadaceae bacterium]